MNQSAGLWLSFLEVPGIKPFLPKLEFEELQVKAVVCRDEMCVYSACSPMPGSGIGYCPIVLGVIWNGRRYRSQALSDRLFSCTNHAYFVAEIEVEETGPSAVVVRVRCQNQSCPSKRLRMVFTDDRAGDVRDPNCTLCLVEEAAALAQAV